MDTSLEDSPAHFIERGRLDHLAPGRCPVVEGVMDTSFEDSPAHFIERGRLEHLAPGRCPVVEGGYATIACIMIPDISSTSTGFSR